MFLIDQNLSRRLGALLGAQVAGRPTCARGGIKPVHGHRALGSSELGLTVLTKDHDFEALAIASGPPPRVVVLAIGNCTTAEAAEVMFANADLIDAFLKGEESILTLTRPNVFRG